MTLPKIGMVVACSPEGGIGIENRLPWHLPGDLSFFRQVTLNQAVIMGRKTYESLPGPLRDRKVLVVTSRPEIFKSRFSDDVEAVKSLSDAVAKGMRYPVDYLMIAGGGDIYYQARDLVEFAYVTISYVHSEYDTYLSGYSFSEEHWRNELLCEYNEIVLPLNVPVKKYARYKYTRIGNK